MAQTKQRTVQLEGEKVKIVARSYSYMGNHCGFRVFIKDVTYKLSYLTPDEAIDAALAKYWGDHMKVHDGFTKAELTKAFDRLDLADWRDPIGPKRVPRQWLRATLAAIEFFTATSARITTNIASRDDVTIEADGYRNGPAGP